MPLIKYLCESNHTTSLLVRNPKDAKPETECKECKGAAKRVLCGPGSKSTVIIDNGAQARAVEVRPDIVEVLEERSQKNLREE